MSAFRRMGGTRPSRYHSVRDLDAVQAAGDMILMPWAPRAHRVLHRTLHRAAEHDALLQLLGSGSAISCASISGLVHLSMFT